MKVLAQALGLGHEPEEMGVGLETNFPSKLRLEPALDFDVPGTTGASFKVVVSTKGLWHGFCGFSLKLGHVASPSLNYGLILSLGVGIDLE